MAETWERLLTRWTDAGVLESESAARIRAFEMANAGSNRLRWPIWLALVFGALALGAGVMLFVSAHWDDLSPQTRFALVIGLVAAFHVGAAIAANRFPAMGTALHATGTIVLGAGIYLAGQIFNLDEHWPGGLMLWTFGAAAACAILRDWPQTALVALLAPGWLIAEWYVAAGPPRLAYAERIAACGNFLLVLAYLTAVRSSEHSDLRRRTLLYLGAIGLIPASIGLAFNTGDVVRTWVGAQPLPATLRIVGWTLAAGLPLIVAVVARGTSAWPNLLATFWVLALFKVRPIAGETALYIWWAVGASALAAWGVMESRGERINLGTAIFTATVLAFYFSQVMDKLERSASLIGLGLLFLGGGWAIDRVRRRLILQAQGGLA